jgi:ankyrin repeat protein
LAELLLERGADPHDGVSLLHASCAFHFEFLTEGVGWLIAHGADPNHSDPQCQTALHKAAFLGYLKAARCLLELGADPDRMDARGLRPADVARLHRKRWV